MFPTRHVGQGQADHDRTAKIAILGLEVVGGSAAIDLESVRIAQELTAALRSRAASGPYAVAPNSNADLIDQKVMHNCPDNRKECMIKIGRALNAEYLLYGQIARKPRRAASTGSYQITLWLLDVNDGQIASWAGFIPVAESSGARLADLGRVGYEHLIVGIRPRREHHAVADNVLVHAANETFWRITRYKPGQKLDMSDQRDRAMSKTWLDIYAQVKGHRDRATSRAQRTLNETVTPYILVVERRDGTLNSQALPQRGNLDVQYNWVVDQPDDYTYIAAFDFTKKRDAPIFDQFSLMRRSQTISGWS
jgi:hypothetical protein